MPSSFAFWLGIEWGDSDGRLDAAACAGGIASHAVPLWLWVLVIPMLVSPAMSAVPVPNAAIATSEPDMFVSCSGAPNCGGRLLVEEEES